MAFYDCVRTLAKIITFEICICCSPVYLHKEKLCRIHEAKFLGYILSEDQSDDVEISKQIHTLYIRSNKLLQMFSYCIIDVKNNYLEVNVLLCNVVYYSLIIEKQLVEN